MDKNVPNALCGTPGPLKKPSLEATGDVGCPAAQFQKMISGKYKLRILWSLKDGPQRFTEIKRGLLRGNVGTLEIAARVLGRELKALMETGMLERKDHQVRPLKVEYRLTARGKSFIPVIAVIHKWGVRHLIEPAALWPRGNSYKGFARSNHRQHGN